MKLLLTICLGLFITFSSNAQINLEHTYTVSQGTFVIGNPSIIQIDSNQYKYFLRTSDNSFSLYNLNHSLYQSVTLPSFVTSQAVNQPVFQYVTKSLFDCDSSTLEFMVSYQIGSSDPPFVNSLAVIRENGDILFSKDSCGPYTFIGGVALTTYPITKTSDGSKLILYNQFMNEAYVYSLCGEYYGEFGINAEDQLAYPNPTTEFIKLPYKLPENDISGTIEIINSNGVVVKTAVVDKSFLTLHLDVSQFDAGEYFYRLKSPGTTNPTSNRFIVSK